MKYLILFCMAALSGLAAFSHRGTAVLTGKISDEKGEPLIGATVTIPKTAQGAVTDVNGQYRLTLEPGEYDVEVSYTGYRNKKITGVRVLANAINTLDVKLEVGDTLQEVVVTSYKVPLIEQDKTSTGQTLSAEQIRALPTRKAIAIVAATAGATSVDGGKAEVKGSRDAATNYYIDGVRVSGPPPPVRDATAPATATEYLTRESEKASFESPGAQPGIPAQPAPRAGLLTAGEWNDLHNWNTHWQDLSKDGELGEFQKTYGFYPKQRFTVLLTNEQDFPVIDAPVALYSRWGELLWETRTDNTGKAELWAGFFDAHAKAGTYQATATIDGKSENLGALKPAEAGINRHRIEYSCDYSKNVDIVWAVDATGSMGDELEYLKTELLDVTGRVRAANPELVLRMGTVFYRDEGDDYVVKSSPLTPNIAQTVGYIRQQSADGGGDYPEAVHSALEEAVAHQDWAPDAVARICFLVLDASPHQSPEVCASLQKSIREAAKRGIRIVPVSASGIQKDTEFLMKFFGLATNGTYVFLTDHSGIGGKHLEPTTDEYKVELLNDLLVRLITEYTSVPDCAGKSSIRFAAQSGQEQTPQNTAPVLYYPNPAVSQFNVVLPFDAQKVTLYDAQGKAVHNLSSLSAGLHSIPVGNLPAGFYTLRIWKDGQVQSGKVLVVSS
ncbi:MAG: carboxypeptidase regulatory-like domain-containing protein [Saprospirales bacterium]|nr:carboxypeptidase regulatory-like domain-containing protein [Saprospirales bacterium]